MADLIRSMKDRIKKSGANKKEIIFFAPDQKRRVRFLQELGTGYEFKFHVHWNRGINALCLEEVGKECPYCEENDEEIREDVFYAWSVFDYDSNATRILLAKVTGVTPVPSFMEFSEEYGTIMDRDYTVKKTGSKRSASITVLPGEHTTFRNKKAKPFSKKAIVAILEKAYPVNADDRDDDEEDDEDEKTVKKSKGKSSSKSSSKSKGKKKKQSLEDQYGELSKDELREIGLSLGYEKKELKGLDEEELIELYFSDYEEEDLQDEYDNLTSDDDEDEDD